MNANLIFAKNNNWIFQNFTVSHVKGWGSNGAKQCHENKRMLTSLMTQNAIFKFAMSEVVILTLPSRHNHDNVSNVTISLSESLSLISAFIQTGVEYYWYYKHTHKWDEQYWKCMK